MIEIFGLPYPYADSRRNRKVYVYIPDSIDGMLRESSGLPVLYMFDGHNLFSDEEATYGKSWGMKEYLEENDVPLIVVGVDCNHSRNHGRLREYSPFTFDDPEVGHILGKGKITMNWFVHILKPHIDQTYPTLPGRETTFIAGSSMGGLMTLYALCVYGDTFSRGASLSPSLWTNFDKIRKMIRESPYLSDSVLYMDYGEKELERSGEMLTQFAQTGVSLLQAGTRLNLRIVPGGEHCEACWEQQIPFFMETLFYDGFARTAPSGQDEDFTQ